MWLFGGQGRKLNITAAACSVVARFTHMGEVMNFSGQMLVNANNNYQFI